MKRIILFALVLSGCSTAVTPFFGATQHGPYYKQFNGQLICSLISGWAPEPNKRVCMCILTDTAFSEDKAFVSAPLVLCQRVVENVNE
jgi:hypothetical protein